MKSLTRPLLFVAAACMAATAAHAGCYTVYNSKGKLVQRSSNPPVDMRYHLNYAMPPKFGKGSTMVFSSTGESCSDHVWIKTGKAKKGKGKAKKLNEAQQASEILDNLVASQRLEIPGYGSILK